MQAMEDLVSAAAQKLRAAAMLRSTLLRWRNRLEAHLRCADRSLAALARMQEKARLELEEAIEAALLHDVSPRRILDMPA